MSSGKNEKNINLSSAELAQRAVKVNRSCELFLFQLVELSKAQDVEAGDGTTSVCVMAGSLLDACQNLLSKGAVSALTIGTP